MTTTAPYPVRTVPWTDPKRRLWLLGLLVPTLPLLAWGLAAATGLGLFWWWGPFFVFAVIPALDLWVGKDGSNAPESVVGWLEQDRYYRWCTYAFLPLQYASLVLACWLWATADLSTVSALGLAVTVGCVSGIAINTAHELGHKKDRVERWLSKIALAQTGYGHFYLEHNRGHHVRVATPEDPASSRLGESFYRFLPRTLVGSLRSAWALERKRFARTGGGFWTPRNDLFNAWAMTAVLYGALVAAFGVQLLPWLVVQAVFGFSLLEVVNYLEHYGLRRQKRPDGRYEPVRPEHSWNSDSVTSNVLLFHLQRHSDHHANATRRFQTLRSVDTAPQLPSGYATMIVLALVPPLWRAVMDPKVRLHYAGDLSLANTQPGKERRYGVR